MPLSYSAVSLSSFSLFCWASSILWTLAWWRHLNRLGVSILGWVSSSSSLTFVNSNSSKLQLCSVCMYVHKSNLFVSFTQLIDMENDWLNRFLSSIHEIIILFLTFLLFVLFFSNIYCMFYIEVVNFELESDFNAISKQTSLFWCTYVQINTSFCLHEKLIFPPKNFLTFLTLQKFQRNSKWRFLFHTAYALILFTPSVTRQRDLILSTRFQYLPYVSLWCELKYHFH